MKTISTEIEIKASPAKVWGILTDIDSWQKWSPTINKSEGNASLGSKVNITMCGKEKGVDGPSYSPIITKLDKEKNLSWKAKMMAGIMMTNGKVLQLEETPSGTRLIHQETFSGLMTLMMWSHMEKGVPPMLNKMNTALKELAETV